jgi:hypothetical protein
MRATEHVIFGSGATVIYQTLNPPYSEWVQQFPAMQTSVLNAARARGARLVSMEKVYMYGRPNGRPITEDRGYDAHTKKGKLRGQTWTSHTRTPSSPTSAKASQSSANTPMHPAKPGTSPTTLTRRPPGSWSTPSTGSSVNHAARSAPCRL